MPNLEVEVSKQKPSRDEGFRRNRSRKNRRRSFQLTDFQLLMTVWRWKLLSYPLAKQLVFPNICQTNSYRKIKRLIKEGYLIECEVIRLGMEVIQLTKKGFDCIKYDLGELTQSCFAAQSVNHDYIATAFHLGEFVRCVPKGVQLVTERELQTTDHSLFPDWTPLPGPHVPDGFLHFKNGDKKKTLAIEVELNHKVKLRYMKVGYYFERPSQQVDAVLWLCDGIGLAQFISNQLFEANLRNFKVHNFILLEHFKRIGWDAQSLSGSFKGSTIKEIYLANGYQNPSQDLVNSWSTQTKKILMDKRKMPVFSEASMITATPKI